MAEKLIVDSNGHRKRLTIKAAKTGCIRCGICCKKYQPHLSLEDAGKIAERLEISWENFKKEYSDPRWPADDSILIRHVNGSCPFLKIEEGTGQALCKIHNFKPTCCREWEANLEKADCKEGLQQNWNLEIDENGEVCGMQDKLEAFSRFLAQLK